MRDLLRVFVNNQLSGSVVGHWVKAVQPVQFFQGNNDLLLLTQTVGLQNYGAFLEKDGAGFRGKARLTGFKNGDIDLSKLSWTYQVGLKGEAEKIYTVEHNEKAAWSALESNASTSIFTWYKIPLFLIWKVWERDKLGSMDTILEGTGVSFPKRMDVNPVIIVEPIIQINAQQIVESLHKPGTMYHIRG
ncbi:hypothetical protein AALP_AA6G066000 [Arabis alpina]|uniref:Uncharacterized protein n=1 Tax=Arabis alpina TaxID=50452 RepID=A0A087GMI0_ARAAL|nr:hypothetical protein AALP_AA6G066000 [Arabis alpina]